MLKSKRLTKNFIAIKKIPPFKSRDKIILNLKNKRLLFYTDDRIGKKDKIKWKCYKDYTFIFPPNFEQNLTKGMKIELDLISMLTGDLISIPMKLCFDTYIKITIENVSINLHAVRSKKNT